MKSLIRILFIVTVACSLVLLVFLFLRSWRPATLTPVELGAGEGFALSLLYYEQIGNGASNVMNLQCWAGSLQMKVVEPFIREVRDSGDQVFYFDLLDFSSTVQQPRFRGLFDFSHWNAYSKSHGYATLVPAEEFLAKASKKLIYVTLMYSGSSKCPKRTGISQRALIFFEQHHFIPVRTVCIDLLHEGRLRTQKEFNKLVFGELLGHGNFTVVFDEWRGIRNESEREGKLDFVDVNSEWHRILIKDSLCWYDCLALQPYYATWVKLDSTSSKSLKHTPQELDTAVLKISKLGLIPSEEVLTDVDTFRDKHLEGKTYLAIKVRMEKYEITEPNLHATCIEKIASLKKYALDEYKLTRTFFTSDLGKYGSNSWSWPQGNPKLSERLYEDMVSALGTPSDRVNTVSQDFEALTHSTGRVRIAWTQGMVVAEARCIIFIGGGAFHALILNMHSALYRENECFVYLDENCNEQAKLGFA